MNRVAIGAVLGLIVGIGAWWGLVNLLVSSGQQPGYAPIGIGIALFMTVFGLVSNSRGLRKTTTAGAATQRQALAMSPPPGHSLVVVYREGFPNRLTAMNFTVDGRDVVQLMSPRFTVFALVPGAHVLTAAFAGVAGTQTPPAQTSFSLGAGEIAVFRVTVRMKLTTSLIVVERDQDIAAVKARLARMRMIMPG